MAPSFVRGNVVYVHSEPPMWAGAYPPNKGDRLTVGVRKKGGWLRVRNHRTGDVTSLKVGPWIQKVPIQAEPKNEPKNEPQNVATPQGSGLDELIRANQVQTLEARIQQMNADFFNEKSRLEACVDRLTDKNEISERHISNLETQIAEMRRDAASQALQLLDAKSQQFTLYEKVEEASKKQEEYAGTIEKLIADADNYRRQINELMIVNEALRTSETELSEHLERTTKQLHDIRPVGQIYSHRDFDWVYPDSQDEEEEEAVDYYEQVPRRSDQHGSCSC